MLRNRHFSQFCLSLILCYIITFLHWQAIISKSLDKNINSEGWAGAYNPPHYALPTPSPTLRQIWYLFLHLKDPRTESPMDGQGETKADEPKDRYKDRQTNGINGCANTLTHIQTLYQHASANLGWTIIVLPFYILCEWNLYECNGETQGAAKRTFQSIKGSFSCDIKLFVPIYLFKALKHIFGICTHM